MYGGGNESGNDAVYLIARSHPGVVKATHLQDPHIELVMKILFNVAYEDTSMTKEEAAVAIKGHENTVTACQRLRGMFDNVALAEDPPFAFLNRCLLSQVLSDSTKLWIVRLINALLGPCLDVQVGLMCAGSSCAAGTCGLARAHVTDWNV